MKLRKVIAWLAAASLVALLVACGGGDDEPGASTTAPADATQDGGGNAEFLAGVVIEASDFKFTPSDLTVELTDEQTGVAIDYENASRSLHTFALYKDKDFEQPVEGGSTSIAARVSLDATTGQVERGKTYYFRCEIHPDRMQGALKIK